MKVKIIKDDSIIEVNDSYGLRLITQGKAVAVQETKKPASRKNAQSAGE